MGEKMREKCLSTVEHEKTLIDNEFPKQKDLTNRIFVEILDFINQDFDGISDNKRYRCFLDLYKNILIISFQENASKAYLRMIFKAMKNKDISKYFSHIMQSRSKYFQDTVDRLCNIFTYVHIEGQKDKKLKKILDLLNGWY